MNTVKNCYSPAGMAYYARYSHRNEKDCPACKYGTVVHREDEKWQCIDCNKSWTKTELWPDSAGEKSESQ